MKDKIIYIIGKHWAWFRKWYIKKKGRKYLWGVVNFLDDFKPTEQYDWALPTKYDDFIKKMEKM